MNDLTINKKLLSHLLHLFSLCIVQVICLVFYMERILIVLGLLRVMETQKTVILMHQFPAKAVCFHCTNREVISS